jgi:hypothetical protein
VHKSAQARKAEQVDLLFAAARAELEEVLLSI